MNIQSEDKNNQAESDMEDRTVIDSSRRKLTKAGSIITPVIMSFSSRPAWAINCTVSGNMSGNASDPAYEQFCSAPGMSVAYWADPINESQWYGPGFFPDDKFNSSVGETVFNGDPTLLQVIRGILAVPPIDTSLSNKCKDGPIENNSKIIELAQLTVAGWQNAQALSGASPPYPFSTLEVTSKFLTGIANNNPSCGLASLQPEINALFNENNP